MEGVRKTSVYLRDGMKWAHSHHLSLIGVIGTPSIHDTFDDTEYLEKRDSKRPISRKIARMLVSFDQWRSLRLLPIRGTGRLLGSQQCPSQGAGLGTPYVLGPATRATQYDLQDDRAIKFCKIIKVVNGNFLRLSEVF